MNFSEIGLYNVKYYGAVGDGVTDDTNAVNNARAAAVAGSGVLLFPVGKFKVTSSITFSTPVKFIAGGSLALAGAITVSFTGPISAPPTQIVSGTITGVTISASTPTVYAEWFGAVGDGKTDDTAAINAAANSLPSSTSYVIGAGGRVQLLAKSYYHASPITINKSRIALVGMGPDITYLVSPSNATTDGLIMGGSSINGVFLEDFTITSGTTLSGPSTSTARGLVLQHIFLIRVRNVNVYRFGTGIYCTDVTTGIIENCFIINEGSQAANVYGIHYDGATSVQSVSLRSCHMDVSGYAGAGFSYGFKADGPHLNDIWLEFCESNQNSFGYYLDLSTATAIGQATDIQFVRCNADQNKVSGLVVNGAAVGAAVTINGGWFTGETPVQININNSFGVAIRGAQVLSDLSNAGSGGIGLTNSEECLIVDNQITNQHTGIGLVNSPGNVIAGNIIFMMTGTSAIGGNGIQLGTGSGRCSVSNNLINSAVLNGYAVGINIGANSDKCNVIGNIYGLPGVTKAEVNDSSNTNSVFVGVTS